MCPCTSQGSKRLDGQRAVYRTIDRSFRPVRHSRSSRLYRTTCRSCLQKCVRTRQIQEHTTFYIFIKTATSKPIMDAAVPIRIASSLLILIKTSLNCIEACVERATTSFSTISMRSCADAIVRLSIALSPYDLTTIFVAETAVPANTLGSAGVVPIVPSVWT